MATTSIVMPKLESVMTEGTVVEWLKAPGDMVKEGEGIATISYEKSTSEIGSPINGVLLKIMMNEDEDAKVGEVIGIIGKE